jgi:hypothetical protein
MMAWEYSKVVHTLHNGKAKNWVEILGRDEHVAVGEEGSDVSKAMAQLGQEGWELIALMRSEDLIETLDPAGNIQMKTIEYYFKRPLH